MGSTTSAGRGRRWPERHCQPRLAGGGPQQWR